ncbi:MAG: hypothetical protein GY832_39035 [Chloroflexi bacterium]|nr:hypothetical protein [Chloroflexota bacterium]
MQLYSYGEDALTLWALQNRLDTILQTAGDTSSTKSCQVFFRPSFGRSGGDTSSQFGEFDFIILTNTCLYLGESKWTRASKKFDQAILKLPPKQLLRHQIFKFYVKHWAFGNYGTWDEFKKARTELQNLGIEKPLAPTNSLLAENLQTVLGIIKKHYSSLPQMQNVLLYLHNGMADESLPQKASEDFIVITIDYSKAAIANFIRLQ